MSFMRRVNPGYIEWLISEMYNLTDRMDEIIELDLNELELMEFNKSVDAVRSMNSTLSSHT